MIQNLKNTFKSTIKSLEILYVLENAKPAARILVKENELKIIPDFIKKNNLEFSISDFKVIKAEQANYSDKSVKIPADSQEKGYFFVYLSKIKELCEKAKAFEEKNMHFELGMVLGYPKCCCFFFAKNFNESNTDLTLDTLENSKGYEFPFYTNIAARHFDVSLLSHFPCSFNCKHSINIAKENLRIVKNNSEQLGIVFENIMKNAVLYTQNQGIFLLKNIKNEDQLTFENITSTAKNRLYDELMQSKKIEIINKNKIEIEGKEIEENLGLMIFK